MLAFEEGHLPFPYFTTSACAMDEQERRVSFLSPWLRFQNLKGYSVDVENHGR
jgi:hypothetical protein